MFRFGAIAEIDTSIGINSAEADMGSAAELISASPEATESASFKRLNTTLIASGREGFIEDGAFRIAQKVLSHGSPEKMAGSRPFQNAQRPSTSRTSSSDFCSRNETHVKYLGNKYAFDSLQEMAYLEVA